MDPAHIQWEQVDSLVSAAGVDGARMILEAFQRSTTELLEALDADLSSGALGEAYKTAHAVKGSAANVGALLLSETAAAIEHACRADDNATAASVLANAQGIFEAFCVQFENHLEQL